MNLEALSFHRKKVTLQMRKRAQLERIAMEQPPIPIAFLVASSHWNKLKRHAYVNILAVSYKVEFPL